MLLKSHELIYVDKVEEAVDTKFAFFDDLEKIFLFWADVTKVSFWNVQFSGGLSRVMKLNILFPFPIARQELSRFETEKIITSIAVLNGKTSSFFCFKSLHISMKWQVNGWKFRLHFKKMK